MIDERENNLRVEESKFDPAYLHVDRHGMPGGYAAPPASYTDFDPAYVAADRHGIPGEWKSGRASIDMGYDPEYLAVDRHGMPGGYVGTPGYHTEFDQPYLDVDRHGIPGGWANPDQETFQTDDDETIQFCKDIVDASDVTELGYLALEKLPDFQIKKIIELRHRKTAIKISKRETTDIESQIYLDLNIIYHMILANKNLYDKDINISHLIGEEYSDIIGVLSSYEQLISGLMIRDKDELLNKIRLLKENVNNNIVELNTGARQV